MIVEGIISVVFGVLGAIFGALPGGNPPGWFLDVGAQLSSLLGYASGMGAWLPLNLAMTIIGAVLACVAASLAIKVTRLVLSLFTGGGGSAA